MKIASLQGNESHFTNLKHELAVVILNHIASDALLCIFVMHYYGCNLGKSLSLTKAKLRLTETT